MLNQSFLIITLTALMVLSLPAKAFREGGLVLHGHRDLIELAVEAANQEFRADLPEQLLQGTFAADAALRIQPSLLEIYCRFLGVDPITQMAICSKRTQLGFAQDIHSLRNFTQSGPYIKLVSAYDACKAIQHRIENSTFEALRRWGRGDRANAEFFEGIALHTIQDSFAPPHSVRDRQDMRIIADICYYSPSCPLGNERVCAHGYPTDPHDRILKAGLLRCMGRIEQCLTDEARMAVIASTQYLIGFANLAHEANPEDVSLEDQARSFLTTFFNEGRSEGYGYFNCEQLIGR